MTSHPRQSGFTLIEMSIVLVIIGLLVGGVLSGRDLITAAQIRSQLAQIESFNTATNTFVTKYDCLPGDCAEATKFGFAARGPDPANGEGDGNGIISGTNGGSPAFYGVSSGEPSIFWQDLSDAHLIAGGFNGASWVGAQFMTENPALYFPTAKMGQGNFVYIYPGVGPAEVWGYTGEHFFAIAVITAVNGLFRTVNTSPGLTVLQAYNMDRKIDDALPQTGSVVVKSIDGVNYNWENNYFWGPADTSATAGSTTSCYDNSSAASGTPGVAGATQHYSIEIARGNLQNCVLSLKASF